MRCWDIFSRKKEETPLTSPVHHNANDRRNHNKSSDVFGSDVFGRDKDAHHTTETEVDTSIQIDPDENWPLLKNPSFRPSSETALMTRLTYIYSCCAYFCGSRFFSGWTTPFKKPQDYPRVPSLLVGGLTALCAYAVMHVQRMCPYDDMTAYSVIQAALGCLAYALTRTLLNGGRYVSGTSLIGILGGPSFIATLSLVMMVAFYLLPQQAGVTDFPALCQHLMLNQTELCHWPADVNATEFCKQLLPSFFTLLPAGVSFVVMDTFWGIASGSKDIVSHSVTKVGETIGGCFSGCWNATWRLFGSSAGDCGVENSPPVVVTKTGSDYFGYE